MPLAIAYARYISCTNRGETDACGVCPSCVKFNKLVHPDVHFVFRGFETAMARAGKLLEDAREEVYLNADFDLSRFAETFHRLKKKGVRIVAFSFYDLGLNREDVEFYTHGGMLTAHQPSRLMLVTDRQMTLTADCGAFANWSGTVSNNGLMVKILSEHIQHDITLLQLQEKYGLEMY